MGKGTPQKLSPGLEAARSQLTSYLQEEEKSKQLTMEDKLSVIDRLIKIEALEFKVTGVKSGSAFDDEEEGE